MRNSGPSEAFSRLMIHIKLIVFRLYRAYQKMYASMHDKGKEPHKTQFRRDENYGEWSSNFHSCILYGFFSGSNLLCPRHLFLAVLLCWVTQDFELYAAFDPLADKVCFRTLLSSLLHLNICRFWEWKMVG